MFVFGKLVKKEKEDDMSQSSLIVCFLGAWNRESKIAVLSSKKAKAYLQGERGHHDFSFQLYNQIV